MHKNNVITTLEELTKADTQLSIMCKALREPEQFWNMEVELCIDKDDKNRLGHTDSPLLKFNLTHPASGAGSDQFSKFEYNDMIITSKLTDVEIIAFAKQQFGPTNKGDWEYKEGETKKQYDYSLGASTLNSIFARMFFEDYHNAKIGDKKTYQFKVESALGKRPWISEKNTDVELGHLDSWIRYDDFQEVYDWARTHLCFNLTKPGYDGRGTMPVKDLRRTFRHFKIRTIKSTLSGEEQFDKFKQWLFDSRYTNNQLAKVSVGYQMAESMKENLPATSLDLLSE